MFPRTYEVVRAGKPQTTTVNSIEALLELRTELELVLQFGEGTTPNEIAVLDEKLRTFSGESRADLACQDSLADMRLILADSLDPANVRTTLAIDADFPDIKEALDMGSIKKEKTRFRKEVEDQLSSNPAATENDSLPQPEAAIVPDTDGSVPPEGTESSSLDSTLAEADSLIDELFNSEPAADSLPEELKTISAQSAASMEISAEPPAGAVPESSGETDGQLDNPDPEEITTLMAQLAADADSVQPADAAGDVPESSTEEAAAVLLAAQTEMNDIAESLEAAVEGLGELNEAVRNVPSPAPPADVGNSTAEFESSLPLEASAEPTDADAAFEAMAAELEAAVNAPQNTPEDGEPEPESTPISEATEAVEPGALPHDEVATSDSISHLAQLDEPQAEIEPSPSGETSDMPTTGPAIAPTYEPGHATSNNIEAGGMRRELDEVKNALTAQIDRLGDLMERSASMRDTVHRTLEQATRFRAAAMQATEASRRFAAAQTAADEARAAYETAQARVSDCRREWETAQQAAAEAAEEVNAVGG